MFSRFFFKLNSISASNANGLSVTVHVPSSVTRNRSPKNVCVGGRLKCPITNGEIFSMNYIQLQKTDLIKTNQLLVLFFESEPMNTVD